MKLIFSKSIDPAVQRLPRLLHHRGDKVYAGLCHNLTNSVVSTVLTAAYCPESAAMRRGVSPDRKALCLQTSSVKAVDGHL
jgi:hypothetical protein